MGTRYGLGSGQWFQCLVEAICIERGLLPMVAFSDSSTRVTWDVNFNCVFFNSIRIEFHINTLDLSGTGIPGCGGTFVKLGELIPIGPW